MTPIRLTLLAFKGMNRRLPASALRPTDVEHGGILTPRELLNIRPHLLQLLVPREALRFIDETNNTDFPFGK